MQPLEVNMPIPVSLAPTASNPFRPARRRLKSWLLVLATPALALPALAQTCQRTAGAQPPAVVELFTSQGCSSCPPADRWLSTLKGQSDVVALSFHVNYWNHLGWKDPYATPDTTDRQRRIQTATQGKYVYTPQVVLNGQDHRNWRGQSARLLPHLDKASAPGLQLSRVGDEITAQVGAGNGRTRLAGYWAVLHDELTQQVTRGENAGEKLVNDHVVSLYQPVSPWSAGKPHVEKLTLPPDAGQRVVFVVTDEGWTQPLQALTLQCS
jgi:hypothetical protein